MVSDRPAIDFKLRLDHLVEGNRRHATNLFIPGRRLIVFAFGVAIAFHSINWCTNVSCGEKESSD